MQLAHSVQGISFFTAAGQGRRAEGGNGKQDSQVYEHAATRTDYCSRNSLSILHFANQSILPCSQAAIDSYRTRIVGYGTKTISRATVPTENGEPVIGNLCLRVGTA